MSCFHICSVNIVTVLYLIIGSEGVQRPMENGKYQRISLWLESDHLCIRCGPDTPCEGAILWGKGRPIV